MDKMQLVKILVIKYKIFHGLSFNQIQKFFFFKKITGFKKKKLKSYSVNYNIHIRV